MHSVLFRIFSSVVLCTALLCSSAHATTIYSTFGETAQTYLPYSGWGLGSGGGFAIPFVPTRSYLLDELDLAAFASLGPSLMNIAIIEGNLETGRTLETFEVSIPTSPWAPEVYRVQSALHPLLVTGNAYWFVTTADDRIKSIITLNKNDQNISGDFYYQYDGAWHPYGGSLPAFGAYGSAGDSPAAPEPSTLVLMCVALASAFLVFKRKRIA